MTDTPLHRVFNSALMPSAGTYVIDAVHTFVSFRARHLVIGRVRGRFSEVAGSVTVAEDPTQSQCLVEIQTASISTLLAMRDDDLRSDLFLDVARYPVMTYRSTGVTEVGEGRWLVAGDLTIRDTTRPVELDASVAGAILDSSGKPRVAFHATGSITRNDFGLTTELTKEDGGLLVGQDVQLEIDAEAVRHE